MALSKQEIEQFKVMFGPVFRVSVGSNAYTCRTITRGEAKAIGILDGITPEVEDLTFLLAVLDPEIRDIDHVRTFPGVDVSEVAQVVLKRSCLLDADDINAKLDEARAICDLDVYATMNAVIIAAFPDRTFEELDALHIDALCDLTAKAEKVNELRALVNAGQYAGVRFASLDAAGKPVIDGIPSGPIDLNDPDIDPKVKDEIVRRKLESAAAGAGIISGQLHEQSFGMTQQSGSEASFNQWSGSSGDAFRERERY